MSSPNRLNNKIIDGSESHGGFIVTAHPVYTHGNSDISDDEDDGSGPSSLISHSAESTMLFEKNVDVLSESQDSSSLMLVEKRQFRSFSRADEYLYAMKEDLAEWLNLLYSDLGIDAENFMVKLETGEILIRHANSLSHVVRKALIESEAKGRTSRLRAPSFQVPDVDLPIRRDVLPGSWFARDNVFNFIKFCRVLGVMECIMFETEDLVCRKNEKHVILTLLEVARRGAKVGMLAPMLVQFEQEIDREIARDEKADRRKQEQIAHRSRLEFKAENEIMLDDTNQNDGLQNQHAAAASLIEIFDSLAVEIDEELRMADVEKEEEGYSQPIGPFPQLITNDLISLDEMVRNLVSECQCPVQFPMLRVSEGKYRIGETKVLIFVRILRNHVMVRVGGGWDTLQHYLDKHDPCKCKSGHRSTHGSAVMTVRTGSKCPMADEVSYNRYVSTPASRRSYSTTNLSSSLSSKSRSTSVNSNSCETPLIAESRERAVRSSSLSTGINQRKSTPRNNSHISSFSTHLTTFKKRSLYSDNVTCDSSSEVSDEGYKSGQGIAKIPVVDTNYNSINSSHPDDSESSRPSSSLTEVISDCSSNISSEGSISPKKTLCDQNRSVVTTQTQQPHRTSTRRIVRSRSFNAGTTSSRYLQAAEAYTTRKRAEIKATTRERTMSRPTTPSSCFRSPSVTRRNIHQRSVSASSEVETDNERILKQMEAILLSYKSKVEDHLAAEGRSLPKDLFDNDELTCRWFKDAQIGRKSSANFPGPEYTPRNELREGDQKFSRIPLPVFYPNRGHIRNRRRICSSSETRS